MAEQPSEWVVYHPPKSAAFGHRMRAKTARKAWQQIGKFLQTVEDIAVNPIEARKLTCYLPPATDRDIALERIREAELEFGTPNGRFESDHPHSNSSVHWNLRPDQIMQGVNFTLDDDRYPEQATGPTAFHFTYLFNWPQFPNDKADQFGNRPRNGISIWIGKSTLGRGIFLQPHFEIPLAWDSPNFRAFLLEVEPQLPFKPSDSNFQRWLLPKTSKSLGRQRKLEKGWRKGWVTQ